MTSRDVRFGGAVSHIGIVQNIYQAFGRRDVTAILEQLADNVEWEYGINSTNVPWLQPRNSRAHVAGRRILEEDETHIWRFNPQGKVSRFRHRVDTHQYWAALEQK